MTYAYNAQLGGASGATKPEVFVQIAIELHFRTAFLRDALKTSQRIAATCTGAFVLAG